MKLPREAGPIHFIGIGGIGMSGIAEVMATLGYKVQGSDLADNYNTARLRKSGIAVAIGHDVANLGEAQVVVVSSAVRPDNPELAEARDRFLPIVRRAEMLAELMRFKSCVAVGGTHGKTTTTSLVAALLDSGGFDPTVINGGIINAYGTNARLGKGDWMVVESDESDGTFVKLPADIVIVTNIDPEHLDHYGSFDKAREAFLAFVENIPFYGVAVMCIDHPEVQALIGRVRDRRIITYGLSPQADVRLVNTSYANGETQFAVRMTDRRSGAVHEIGDLALQMPGDHNALNATAALAVAKELGIPDEKIRNGFRSFAGVKRRFTRTGEHDGVAVFDDYGHHPVEISAVLRAARGVTNGKVIAVMQPHRFTRLASLFVEFCTCFNDADSVIVAPVYAAGETPIEGATHDALVEGLRSRGHRSVQKIDQPEQLAPMVKALVGPGDIIVCLGAGTITQWAYTLPQQLAALDGKAEECVMALLHGEKLLRRLPKPRGKLDANVPLADFTWFRVGGPAEVLFSPADEPDLSDFLQRIPEDVAVNVIGVGSNLLVRDGGVPGVVIRLGKGFGQIAVEADFRIRTGTAVPDVRVARFALDHSIGELTFLRGIPGTIGGALRMNGGAYGQETKDVLLKARAVDRRGTIHVLANADMRYTYRHCGAPDDLIFTEALLQGKSGNPAEISRAMTEVTERREATQPIKSRTGGSTFKNPPGHKSWQLIDKAGLRGFSIGPAKISELHCNFLINEGGATAAQIEELGETIRRRVKENSGVDLDWEIKRIGIPAGSA